MIIDDLILRKLKNKKILIAVSGGVDSMVLLDLLYRNSKIYKYELEVFHFNHQTRDGKSDEDEILVKNKAKDLNLVYYIETDSMEQYSKEMKISEEEAGRILRYIAMEKIISEKKDKDKYLMALAHNLDDQIETVLMRIIRGTGIDGLVGMKVFENNIFRPLIHISKSKIIDYAKENSINYNDDYTNRENIYHRNSIRNELIPFLQNKYNPNIYNAIASLSALADEQKTFIDNLILNKIDDLVKYQDSLRSVFGKYDLIKLSEFEVKEILRREIERIKSSNYDFEYSHYGEILKILYSSNASHIKLNDMIFYNSNDKFIISRLLTNELDEDISFKTIKGDYYFNGYHLNLKKVKNNNEKSLILPANESFILRKRKDGDRIFINGKYRKLKDFLIDKKIDRYLRDYLPIVEYNDEIVMVSDLYFKEMGYNEGVLIKLDRMKENYE